MIYKLNGEVINVNQSHTITGVNYPDGWFLDITNRIAMGVTEEPDPVIVRPLADVKTEAISYINAEANVIILSKYPLWYQANCADGTYATAVVTQFRANKIAIIAASNVAQDAINAATDETAVRMVKAIWPVI